MAVVGCALPIERLILFPEVNCAFGASETGQLRSQLVQLLKIAIAEVASMILAHKTISDDEFLHHYALITWEKFFEAQLQFEREISAMLEPQEGNDPWAEKQKVYIGLAKSKAILTLHESGNQAVKSLPSLL